MIVFMGADGSIGVNVCVCVWRSLEAPFRSCRDALRMKLIFFSLLLQLSFLRCFKSFAFGILKRISGGFVMIPRRRFIFS